MPFSIGKRTAPKDLAKKYAAKIVMVGSAGVGKTSILLRHNGQGFVTKISPTVGCSFITSHTKCEDREVELQIWDPAGQECYRSLIPQFTRNAVAAVLVFDLTDKTSFQDLPFWIEEVRRNSVDHDIPFFILANKCDLTEKVAVSDVEIAALCEKYCAPFHFTSALSGKGIHTGIVAIAKNLLAHHEKERAEEAKKAEALKLEKAGETSSVKKYRGCCVVS